MASPLYTTFEVNPQDTGYVIQHDHYDGGQTIDTVVPVAGAPAAAANYASLVAKARAAVTANQTFLALGNSPSNAQIIAQTQALTRQHNALIYFLLHALTGLSNINGT